MHIKNHKFSFFILVLLELTQNAKSWHFLLTEGTTRCVFEELLANSVFIADFIFFKNFYAKALKN